MNYLIKVSTKLRCISCSRETYNALTNWLTDARTLASQNIVIVLVGNKKDLEAEREVTFLEASRFAQENGMMLSTVSSSILQISILPRICESISTTKHCTQIS